MDIRDVICRVNAWEVFGLHLESITWHGCSRYAIVDNRYVELGDPKGEYYFKTREIVIKAKGENIILRASKLKIPTLHPYSDDKRLTLLYSMHQQLFSLQELLRDRKESEQCRDVQDLIQQIQRVATQLGFIPLPSTLEQLKNSLIGRLARLMAKVPNHVNQ